MGKNSRQLQMIYLQKCLKYVLTAVCVVALSGCFFMTQSHGTEELLPGGQVSRQEPGGNSKVLDLQVGLGGDREDVSVEIEARELSDAQIQEEFAKGKQYILENYLGSNKSSQSVSQALVLAESLPDSVIEINWQLDNTGFIQKDGTLQIQELEEPQQVEITAQLSYGEEQEDIPIELTLVPPDVSKSEKLWMHWRMSLEKNLQETSTDKNVQLPMEVDGEKVVYHPAKKSSGKRFVAVGVVLIILAPVLLNSQMKKQLEERDKELRRDYPEMIEQFVLLVGAGMTIKGAWMQMVGDYLQRRRDEQIGKRYLYEEMSVTVREIENGMTENRAYELFGKRTGILSYIKFSTLLVQNLRKGSADLLRILEYEALDSFRERKEHAKTLGEEAGTKLLFPMLLMLLVVFSIILYAAFRSM
ncbi:MAG: hypothetical protein J1E62_08610 [Lachnospiraceae bacterium]|nr:hypothetical protein [Lachnospiraceae bacterium]